MSSNGSARVHPRRRLNEWLQRLDDLQGSLSRCARQGMRNQQIGVAQFAASGCRGCGRRQVLEQRREMLERVTARFGELARRQFEEQASAAGGAGIAFAIAGAGAGFGAGLFHHDARGHGKDCARGGAGETGGEIAHAAEVGRGAECGGERGWLSASGADVFGAGNDLFRPFRPPVDAGGRN